MNKDCIDNLYTIILNMSEHNLISSTRSNVNSIDLEISMYIKCISDYGISIFFDKFLIVLSTGLNRKLVGII